MVQQINLFLIKIKKKNDKNWNNWSRILWGKTFD